MKHILIVDDEHDLVNLVAYNLHREGYSTTAAYDAVGAMAALNDSHPDILILDVMLPDMSGFELMKKMKANQATKDIPVIFLTARTSEDDAVEGLTLGADDYITKPFSPKELIARIRAVMRRSPLTDSTFHEPSNNTISIGDIVIDRETYSATKSGVRLTLSATEFRILVCLAERNGKVIRRDQLITNVWQDDSTAEPRTIDVHIRRLRMAIEDDPAEPSYIKTLRGVGYYLVDPQRVNV